MMNISQTVTVENIAYHPPPIKASAHLAETIYRTKRKGLSGGAHRTPQSLNNLIRNERFEVDLGDCGIN